jgi:hypothetical protein
MTFLVRQSDGAICSYALTSSEYKFEKKLSLRFFSGFIGFFLVEAFSYITIIDENLEICVFVGPLNSSF